MKNNNYKNNTNNRNYNKGITTQRIDIDSIYKRMKQTIANRAIYQKEMDNLWAEIKRYHIDKTTEMQTVIKKIGRCNNEMNKLIGQLCQYKKTHKAMNLVYDYLKREIDRNNKIIMKTTNAIQKVKSGRDSFVDTRGNVTYDYKTLLKYIEKKTERINKQRELLEYVKRYRG